MRRSSALPSLEGAEEGAVERPAHLLHLGDHAELEDLFAPRVPQHGGQEAHVVEPARVYALQVDPVHREVELVGARGEVRGARRPAVFLGGLS